MSKVSISDESLVRLAAFLYQTSSETNQPVPVEGRSHWLKLARAAASFFRTTMLEPGMKSHLAPSKGTPATLVEVVSIRFPTLVTVQLPDGSLLEAEHDTLNNWSIDFGWTSTDPNGVEHLTHIDTFNPMTGPHPITGEPWRRNIQPDVFKLVHTQKLCPDSTQALAPDETHSQE
jgi:hypothetical protein